MPLDPGIFKSTPWLKVLKRDHRRGILGSILCPFGIRPDWQCVTSYISGAARSVSRDIPFVSAPFAQEKDTAVPALQQQHATAVIWCRCHSTKTGQNKELCSAYICFCKQIWYRWRHDARYMCPPPTTATTATATRRGRKSFKVQELPQVNSFNAKLPCAINVQIEHCSKSVGN